MPNQNSTLTGGHGLPQQQQQSAGTHGVAPSGQGHGQPHTPPAPPTSPPPAPLPSREDIQAARNALLETVANMEGLRRDADAVLQRLQAQEQATADNMKKAAAYARHEFIQPVASALERIAVGLTEQAKERVNEAKGEVTKQAEAFRNAFKHQQVFYDQEIGKMKTAYKVSAAIFLATLIAIGAALCWRTTPAHILDAALQEQDDRKAAKAQQQ